jgi:hypothetical protein
MNTLYETLISLSPEHDAEMKEGYQRYVALLETVLTPEQMEAYAEFIRRTGEIRIFEEMTMAELAALEPQERAVAEAVVADQNISMENRRVVALLNQRGEHEVAPDLGVAVERY